MDLAGKTDLKGMTEQERFDILYADASWLNDDGTRKNNYEKLHGAITGFLEDHKHIIFDLLDTNTGTAICEKLHMTYGTFQNWLGGTIDRPVKIGEKGGRKRKRTRSTINNAEDIVDDKKKKVVVEVSFITRLQQEQTDIQNEIKRTEQLAKKLPAIKKVLDSIGHLITQYQDLDEPSLDGAIDVALLNVVQDVPVYDGRSITFKHSEQSSE